MAKKQINNTNSNRRFKSQFNFSFNNVNQEEILRAAVESDLAVFLHGMSSDGKSARVKELDPDCTIIYLSNATPEMLNGRSICVPGTEEIKDIKPTWLVKLEEKCANEPNKIHILFFDELTNAVHTIQGMAFNIVLDKSLKRTVWGFIFTFFSPVKSNPYTIALSNDIFEKSIFFKCGFISLDIFLASPAYISNINS